MHHPQIDGIDFAAHLIQTFQNHFEDNASECLTEDLDAIKTFAEMPELKAALSAGKRLRLNAMDLHPFAERLITSALDELGL